jgi:HSP20 family protein
MVEKTHTAGWWPQVYEPLRNIGAKIADWFAPASDAASTEDAYEINMELPGVEADDIDIAVNDGQLTVRGEKRFQREEKGRTYYFSEREYGAFQRSFRLPTDADADNVAADFQNGVLTVRIPKTKPRQESAKKIQIRTG